MRRLGLALAVVAAMGLLGSEGVVNAAPITGQGDPSTVFPGGTVVNFDAGPTGTYNAPVTVGGVQFEGNGTFYIDNAYINQYNSRGVYSLHNDTGEGRATTFTVTFTNPVSAFAFLWGASDRTWRLTAYDGVGGVIETLDIAPLGPSNAGDYFGINAGAATIKSFTIVNQGGEDYVFMDNLNFGEAQTVVTPRQLKQRVITNLTALLPTFDKNYDKWIPKSIAHVQLSLWPGCWADDNHLTLYGTAVFAQEYEAIEDRLDKMLENPSLDPGLRAVVQAAVDDLIAADESLALTALAEAIAGAGPGKAAQKEVAEAGKDYNTGLSIAAAGGAKIRVRYAIRAFRDSWVHSQKALGRKPK